MIGVHADLVQMIDHLRWVSDHPHRAKHHLLDLILRWFGR